MSRVPRVYNSEGTFAEVELSRSQQVGFLYIIGFQLNYRICTSISRHVL